MSDLDQRCNFSLELFREISLASILTMVSKFELLDGDIVFFIGCFVDVRAGTSAYLLL